MHGETAFCLFSWQNAASGESFFLAITRRNAVPYGNSGEKPRIFPDFFRDYFRSSLSIPIEEDYFRTNQ